MPREGWVGLVYLCGERNCNKAGLHCPRMDVTTAVCMRVSMPEYVHMHVPECMQSPEQRCDLVRQHVTANYFSKMLLPHEQPGRFLNLRLWSAIGKEQHWTSINTNCRKCYFLKKNSPLRYILN